MNDSALSLENRIELVKNAIKRIETAKLEYLVAEADPSTSSGHRTAMKDRLRDTENEFGWQWENVKAILIAKGIQ